MSESVLERITLWLTNYLIIYFWVTFKQITFIKSRIDYFEDKIRKEFFPFYLILRWLPIILIATNIQGNLSASQDLRMISTKLVINQLNLIYFALAWWEVAHMYVHSHRISSFVFGLFLGLILYVSTSSIPLGWCIIWWYIITSCQESLNIDYEKIVEFLLDTNLNSNENKQNFQETEENYYLDWNSNINNINIVRIDEENESLNKKYEHFETKLNNEK